MTSNQYYISIGLAGLCAALGLALLILGGSARGLQGDVQKLQTQYQAQQEQINAGVAISQQVVPALFKDLAAHPENIAIRALIEKHASGTGAGKSQP